MTAWALFSALKRVPARAWAAIALVVAVGAVYGLHLRAVSDAFDRGKQSATHGVTFDSAMVARAAEAVALRTAHTDTVVKRVVVTRTRVESLLVALPDSTRLLPVVPELVANVSTLLVQVDTLTAAITAERAAWSERAKVDSAAIYALRVLGTARGDSIQALSKRPTKKKAALYALLGATTGFLGGLAR